MRIQKSSWISYMIVTVLGPRVMAILALSLRDLFIQQLLFGPDPAATGGPAVSLVRSYVRR